jgi:hypothetical protein
MLAFIFGIIVGFLLATALWSLLDMASKGSRQEETQEQEQIRWRRLIEKIENKGF